MMSLKVTSFVTLSSYFEHFSRSNEDPAALARYSPNAGAREAHDKSLPFGHALEHQTEVFRHVGRELCRGMNLHLPWPDTICNLIHLTLLPK